LLLLVDKKNNLCNKKLTFKFFTRFIFFYNHKTKTKLNQICSSYTVFLALNSADFCNAYLRSESSREGIVSLAGYLQFWGIVFLIFSVFVALCKREPLDLESSKYGVAQVYRQIFSIVSLSKMKSFALLLLTTKLAFVASDSITTLKLVEKGFKRENMAAVMTLAFPIESIMAILVGKWAKEKPLSIVR